MKKVVFIILALFLCLFACNGISTDFPPDVPRAVPAMVTEPIEVVYDMGGREIIIAAWSYLPFVTGGAPPDEYSSRNYALDRMFYERIQRTSAEFNIVISEILIEHSEILPALRRSAASGVPFADVVLLGGEMVFPAVTDGLIYALEDFVPGGSGVWGSEPVLRPSAVLADRHWTFAPYALELEGMFLGVNLDILREIGAENPLRLLEDGDWTFETFREMLKRATDAELGRFGISGVPGDIISHLIAANDGIMIRGYEYAYDDPRTVTALELAFDIFQTDRSWLYEHGAQNWRDNLFAFLDGNSAFFPVSEWALSQAEIDFSFTIVPFPKGPDNDEGYSFMKGFGKGLAVPVGVRNPEDVYAVLASIFGWADGDVRLMQERERGYISDSFVNQADMLRALGILREQGKFDFGMAVPMFGWVNGILAEGFISGDLNVMRGVEMFRLPQQAVIDAAFSRQRTDPTEEPPQGQYSPQS